MRLREDHLQPTGGRRGLDISRRSVSEEEGSGSMATGRARMYFISKKKEDRDRAMVDRTFGLHLDCMGGTPECGQWQNRSSSQYVLEFSSGCFNVLWIFSIRWAYIRM